MTIADYKKTFLTVAKQLREEHGIDVKIEIWSGNNGLGEIVEKCNIKID